MSDLDARDKLIIRSWSAVVARGEDDTPEAVAAETTKTQIVDSATVARRMSALRACGQLPWPEVERAS